ncbi:MAG: CsbD family protein [Elainellaceae cyanobacterium]
MQVFSPKYWLRWTVAIAFSLGSLVIAPSASWATSVNPILATGGNSEAAAIVRERAESQLDEAAGAGTSDQIKGRIQEGIGKVKEQAGDLTDNRQKQAEGITDQVKGRVQRGTGQAKAAAEDLSEEAEDQAKGIVESVKDFFD